VMSSILVIASNDPDEATVTVSLSGTGLSNVVNNPPSAPVLVSPADGQTGLGSTAEFRWKKSTDSDGDAVTYRLTYCQDLTFTGCSPIEVAATEKQVMFAGFSLSGTLLFMGSILAWGRTSRRRMLLLVITIAVLAVFGASCGGGGGGNAPSTTDGMSYQVPGMSPGTTYYWKVAADDGKGGIAESAVWSFTTQ